MTTPGMDYTGSDPTPLSIKAGDPIAVTWTVTAGGAAVDFTGATLTAAVRPREDLSTTAIGTSTLTASGSDLTFSNTTHGLDVGRYWWAVKAVLADGTIYRGQGPLIVEPAGV